MGQRILHVCTNVYQYSGRQDVRRRLFLIISNFFLVNLKLLMKDMVTKTSGSKTLLERSVSLVPAS